MIFSIFFCKNREEGDIVCRLSFHATKYEWMHWFLEGFRGSFPIFNVLRKKGNNLLVWKFFISSITHDQKELIVFNCAFSELRLWRYNSTVFFFNRSISYRTRNRKFTRIDSIRSDCLFSNASITINSSSFCFYSFSLDWVFWLVIGCDLIYHHFSFHKTAFNNPRIPNIGNIIIFILNDQNTSTRTP